MLGKACSWTGVIREKPNTAIARASGSASASAAKPGGIVDGSEMVEVDSVMNARDTAQNVSHLAHPNSARTASQAWSYAPRARVQEWL